MTRTLNRLAAALLLVLCTAAAAAADDIAVVVNKSNPTDTTSMTELRKILLAQQRQWSTGGKKIVVVLSAAERAAALKAICGMSETDYNIHFMHATFNGEDADPPRVVAGGAQAKQSVAASPGAVAFIRAADVDDSVKVLTVNGKAPGQAGYPVSPK